MPRTIVIGDIHGCYDELLELLSQLELQEEDFLLSLGDIVDRGNKSREVYHFFKSRPNSKVLMGNHERKHLHQILNYAQEIVQSQFGEEYPAFLDWLQNLEYYHETPEAIIVHAAFEPNRPLQAQREDVLSGSTSGERYLEQQLPAGTYWTDHYQGNKPVIYGHHVVGDRPKIINNTYGIDTGACHGGYLTAVELPGFIIHQVKVKTDHWAQERAKWQLPVLQAKNWKEMEFASIQAALAKLAYIENPGVKAYLKNIENWLELQEMMLEHLLDKLYVFNTKLTNLYRDRFNEVASAYFFKTFLFKAKKGTLDIEDLQKGLNTPLKREQVVNALILEEIDITTIKVDHSFKILNLNEIIIGLIEASGFLFDIYNFDQALKNIYFAIQLSSQYELPHLELEAYSHLAYMQSKEIDDQEIVTSSLEKCISIAEKFFPTQKNDLARYYYRLGLNYHHTVPEKLIECHSKALQIQDFGNEDCITLYRIHRDLGKAYLQLQQLDTAEHHYLQAIEISTRHNTSKSELSYVHLFGDIIRLYEAMQRPDLAGPFQKRKQKAEEDFYKRYPHLKQ